MGQAQGAKDRRAFGPDQGARGVQHHAVNQIFGNHQCGKRGPPFAQDARDPLGRQRLKGCAGQDMGRGGQFDQLRTGGGPSFAGILGRIGAMQHPNRRHMRAAAQFAVGGMGQVCVDHNPHGLAGGPHIAHRQIRIIRPRRARPHQHGVMAQAQGMHSTAGLRAGDPTAFAALGRRAAIERCSHFQRHQWQALGDTFEKARVGIARGLFQYTLGHGNAHGPQHGMAPARHARVGIGQRGYNPRNPRRTQSLGTGRGLAVMRAGFQRDIGRGTPRRFARLRQGHSLGMRSAAKLRPATPHHSAVHDHAAHRRIGPSATQAPRT